MREQWITSRSNPRVQLLRAAATGKGRPEQGLLAAEGEHLLEEAVRAGIVFHTVFVAGQREVPAWLPREVPLVRLPDAIFRGAVETEAPQGIAALLEPPVWTLDSLRQAAPTRAALLLVLAEVQDPGNVGTLLRSAEAFGATGAILSTGTASAWSGKALRASAGSAFRIPSLRLSGAQSVRDALRADGRVRLLAAAGEPRGQSTRAGGSGPSAAQLTPIHREDLTAPVALMIGNEGAGLGRDWLDIADALVTVPCSGPVESLNAAMAGAVMLYEAQRQRSPSTPERQQLVPAAGAHPNTPREGNRHEPL